MINILYLIIFLGVWNIITFLMYGVDKQRARNRERRISERTLITCALLMGSLGALLGMNFFRHKTKKSKFRIMVPLAIAMNIGVIILLVYFGVVTLS